MKNAYVTEHHSGDDGTVDVGMILLDVSNKRFGELEKLGLVREATPEEVKAGYQPQIEADPSKRADDDDNDDDGVDLFAGGDSALVTGLRGEIEDGKLREASLTADLTKAREELAAANAALDQARASLDEGKEREATMSAELAKAQAELEAAKQAAKAAPKPDNKKAADPANKDA
jgi:hypothetical protein